MSGVQGLAVSDDFESAGGDSVLAGGVVAGVAGLAGVEVAASSDFPDGASVDLGAKGDRPPEVLLAGGAAWPRREGS